MILAKVSKSYILSHFEGDESMVNLVPDESGIIIAPMPDWAVELRENNLREKVAGTVLRWNYTDNEFTPLKIEAEWGSMLETTLNLVRQKRNAILNASDSYFNTPDRPVDENIKNELLEFRQKLRDLPSNTIFSNAESFENHWKSIKNTQKSITIDNFIPEYSENIKPIISVGLDFEPVINFTDSAEILETRYY